MGRQRRLISDRGGNASEQRRDLRARLGEPEDVVDEEQHVLAFLVAEVLGEGEPGQADTGPRARGLVHLSVYQGCLRALGPVRPDHAGFHHLVVEVVALARPLADPGKHREAAVRLGDVVDQFHDDHGLADTGAAKQSDLSALGVWCQQVHHLDARDQDLRLRRLVDIGRGRPVNGIGGPRLDRLALVDHVSDDVDQSPKGLRSHRHLDRLAGIDHL